ncbi:MAG: terminase [Arcanobacterium sp.]|nr:terminase [Arcanobacterium sp.]
MGTQAPFDIDAYLDQCDDRTYQLTLPPKERTVTMPPGLPKYTLGYYALAWIENNLRVPSGVYAGKPFECTFDQALFLLWWYAVDEKGEWLYQRGIRRLSKGSGKTPFVSAMALFELLGECRFAGFDDTIPGGCVAKPVALPLVQLAATSEAQTGVTMRTIIGMANKRSAVAKKYELDVGRTYIYTPTGGRLQLLTSSATSAEGYEPSFTIADEVEHWTPAAGGAEMAHVLRRNLAKTGNRLVETCNAWIPGQESVAEKSFEEWCTQEEHKTRADQLILYDARIAPGLTSLTDEKEDGKITLTQGLEFCYKHTPWAALKAIRNEIWSPSTPVSMSRRFYLNQPNAAANAWIDLSEWAQLADPSRDLVDGEEVVLFFDGSKSGDHTALVGCCMADGHVFTVGVWAPEKITGVVNTARVDIAVAEMFDRFTVVAFWADVKEWESFVKSSWPEQYGEQLLVPAQPSGKAAALIAWDMRSHGYDFAMASEQCRAEIQDHKFTHDGNWETSRHIGNARETERRGFITIKKESPKSPNKIDAAVCVIGARMVYRTVLASQEWAAYTDASDDWVVY